MILRLNPIKSARLGASLSAAAIALALGACSGAQTEGTDMGADMGGAETTDKLALAEPVTLNGAGASFPAPIYQRWFQDMNQQYPNLQVNYQSVGSGAGVRQFTAGTVDFGASDVAMTDEELQEMQKGALMLPMTAGSIVLAYNLPGVEDGLQLPRAVYTDILLGNIQNWNDPQIAEVNPDVNLPDQPITVVHRSDGSGTTGVFTKHLSAISPEWESQVGAGKTVEWPTGVGAKGNEGVTAQIQQTPGAIGYVEYGYAKNNDLNVAALENQAGNYIMPSEETAASTLDAVTLPENMRAFITDPEGENSYPIVTYTWLLAYENYEDPQTAKAVEAAIEYGLTKGQEAASQLGYIPLPPSVREKVAAKADQISPEYDIEVSE
ncbi:phosphate ABC transporter substrate-binding protein PstS [Phormidium sp. CCY1219]|uniref:phosphate ABC transporter substrate-binding protein PstS n=1 Tax=Phormidium sp. CCY1219 TaxID=2886104 RepID=UPI002D1E8AE2|nr:phosphate ABC transporter substrate-binding protein PstS [Phormidium sp. CCY1219]MEB3826614.1 phosphate ABC transporter substrate-binding protein PstS [Phormidium sp. CCY1219]